MCFSIEIGINDNVHLAYKHTCIYMWVGLCIRISMYLTFFSGLNIANYLHY